MLISSVLLSYRTNQFHPSLFYDRRATVIDELFDGLLHVPQAIVVEFMLETVWNTTAPLFDTN